MVISCSSSNLFIYICIYSVFKLDINLSLSFSKSLLSWICFIFKSFLGIYHFLIKLLCREISTLLYRRKLIEKRFWILVETRNWVWVNNFTAILVIIVTKYRWSVIISYFLNFLDLLQLFGNLLFWLGCRTEIYWIKFLEINTEWYWIQIVKTSLVQC